MDQEDYLMREIAKIGLLLRAIINNFLNRNENLAITTGDYFENTKELLINEINFDMDKFLVLNESDSLDYLSQFKGINSENLELLAEIVSQFGIDDRTNNKSVFLKKALQLYNLCENEDMTFSFDRERKIKEIKNALS